MQALLRCGRGTDAGIRVTMDYISGSRGIRWRFSEAGGQRPYKSASRALQDGHASSERVNSVIAEFLYVKDLEDCAPRRLVAVTNGKATPHVLYLNPHRKDRPLEKHEPRNTSKRSWVGISSLLAWDAPRP